MLEGGIKVEGKASFIILIAIVAFLSLALALFGGYVFFFQSHHEGDASGGEGSKVYVPKDEEISTISLFSEKQIFNLKATDAEPGRKIPPMLQINGVELDYFIEVAGIKNPTEKITKYKSKISELVSEYFQSVSYLDVKSVEGREKIKKDLLKKINDLLKENEKSKNDIIYNIIFQNWVYT
jgi:flagellar basal body-associated protein FliL